MQNRNQIISYKNSSIHVSFFGDGNEWLFCFHGYGENANSFEVLQNTLGKKYTLAAMDLPYHGETKWNEGLLITPDDLFNIIQQIIHLNPQINVSKFSLLAFSLGGRVALHLLQTIPQKIERVVLIAPDGLHRNLWYMLGTQTLIGNKLFSYTMKHPQWFFSLMNMGGKLGLLNKSIIKFVHHYLDDAEERWSLYQRWTTMRKFKPNSSAVTNAISKYNIPVRLLFGRHDRIILRKRSVFFHNNKNVKVTVIDAGHQLLKEKYVHHIAALFSQ